MKKQTDKVLFAFVSFPHLKICFPVSQRLRREVCFFCAVFPFIEKASTVAREENRIWDKVLCWWQNSEKWRNPGSFYFWLVFHLAKFKWRENIYFFLFLKTSVPALSPNEVHFLWENRLGKRTHFFCLPMTYCEILFSNNIYFLPLHLSFFIAHRKNKLQSRKNVTVLTSC